LQIRTSRELPDQAKKLIDERAKARRDRDFAKSDELRDQLAALGIEVRDTSGGQEWSWRIN
jgi:cysteinyl-tRNA synthetase